MEMTAGQPSTWDRVPAGGVLRFQIVDTGDRASEAWRIWTTATTADVYIGARSIANDIKVSLHQSGIWQHGFSEDGAKKAGVDAKDRLFQRWKAHADLIPGWQRPVQIIFAADQLQAGGTTQPETVRKVSAPARHNAAIVELWMESPGEHPPLRVDDAAQIDMISRGDEGSVWVFSRAFDLPWVPAERFRLELAQARESRKSLGLPPSGLRRIAVHELDEDTGTLILCELAVD
jgi:hypothetical protein